MHKCMNEWVKGGRALGSMSVSYYNELWLWGSHLTINNLKMGRFTTACLPHTLVSKIKVLYLQQCFENHQALYEYAIPWLNTILCKTWWHQHLIPIITPNWQWSWEKRHQKVLHLFNSFFFFNVPIWPCMFLWWPGLTFVPLSAWITYKVSTAQKLFVD